MSLSASSTSPARVLGRVHALERQWEQAERCWKKAEPHLPPPVAWITGVERCVALAERGRAEAARAALAQGAEAVDASSTAGRALALGFCHAAELASGDGAEAAAHRDAIRAAQREAANITDPMICDLAGRLRARLRGR